MKLFANFVYGFDGYTIEYISTSPDDFDEDALVMTCDVNNKLIDSQLDWKFNSDSWKMYNGTFSIDYFKDNDGKLINIVDVIDCEDGNYGTLNLTYKDGKKIKEEFISDEEVESEYVSQSN